MQQTPYDYLIVGSGLYGSVFAHEATQRGHKCLVIDKRSHTGGNVFCKDVDGIKVHVYGPHIFHTNDKDLWDYVNRFASFNGYVHQPTALYNGEMYNLPFNMNTFYQLWKVTTPEQAQRKIEEQRGRYADIEPQNLEEQALQLVGSDIYEKLIRHYTEKQWGMRCSELPAFIIKRLPVRFRFDNNYFNDRYQGIPAGGYNTIINNLLEGIEVRTDVDLFADRDHWMGMAKRVVYTGAIDAFYNYQFGKLEYRSLRFEHETLPTPNFQGNTQVNYTDAATPWTRIVEHKHFEFGTQPHTVITREYSLKHTEGAEPYYPINDDRNMRLFKRYRELADQEPNVIFGGRLAEYRYYDMHQVIASALVAVKNEFGQ